MNENGFVELNGALQLNGSIDNYSLNGTKSMSIGSNQIAFYAWNDNGNIVGKIGAVRRSSDNRVGLNVWADAGDLLILGTQMSNGQVKSALIIDANDSDSPPWIMGGVSGTFETSYAIVTVKHGIITGWTAK